MRQTADGTIQCCHPIYEDDLEKLFLVDKFSPPTNSECEIVFVENPSVSSAQKDKAFAITQFTWVSQKYSNETNKSISIRNKLKRTKVNGNNQKELSAKKENENANGEAKTVRSKHTAAQPLTNTLNQHHNIERNEFQKNVNTFKIVWLIWFYRKYDSKHIRSCFAPIILLGFLCICLNIAVVVCVTECKCVYVCWAGEVIDFSVIVLSSSTNANLYFMLT